MTKPDGTSSAKRFLPPYLRADIPAEKKQIDSIIASTIPRWTKDMTSTTQVSSRLNPNILHGELTTASSVTQTDAATTALEAASDHASSALPAGRATPAGRGMVTASTAQGPAQQAKIEASLVSVLPSGTVPLGWYCDTEFRATLLGGEKMWCNWYVESGSISQYIGTNYGGTAYFMLNGQTYYLYPSSTLVGNNSSSFKIKCTYSSTPLLTRYSDVVYLNFEPFINNNPCVSLAEATFVGAGSSIELVGDNHGAQPRLRVGINHPAGPTGQMVYLIMDDPHDVPVGRWLGNNYLTIPHLQTSIEAEGIIGTRKVLSTKTISVRARVNGVESSPLTIQVKKK